MQSLRIRCSNLGLIIPSVQGLTDKQRAELKRLQGLEKRTPKQEETVKDYIKKDAYELSIGAKTYIEEIFVNQKFNFQKSFSNKYTRKGNDVEQRSIRQVGVYLGYKFASKAKEEYLEDEYICTNGIDWKVKDLVLDQKNVYEPKGLKHFQVDKDLNLYIWQIKGYCRLLGLKKGAIIRVLMNMSEEQIYSEAKRLWVENGNHWSDEMPESFVDEVRELYDFEAKQPIEKRMKIHYVELTERDNEIIEIYCKLAQDHWDKISKEWDENKSISQIDKIKKAS